MCLKTSLAEKQVIEKMEKQEIEIQEKRNLLLYKN